MAPKEWSRGSIKGVALRGGIVMENMTWSEQDVEVTFLSQTDQKVGVALRGEKVTEISLRAGKSSKFTF